MTEPFRSIHYPIQIDAGLGTLAEENRYVAHITQLMRQVLLTNPGERINRPDFGCGVKQMLFAPNNEIAESLGKLTIVQALEHWLGSVIEVEHVELSSNEEKLEIHIHYTITALQTRKNLNLEISLP